MLIITPFVTLGYPMGYRQHLEYFRGPGFLGSKFMSMTFWSLELATVEDHLRSLEEVHAAQMGMCETWTHGLRFGLAMQR